MSLLIHTSDSEIQIIIQDSENEFIQNPQGDVNNALFVLKDASALLLFLG
jgi:hypothetical protein